ncbi:MAG: flagellin [Gammaproteobacteria bacterium]|nr:flagellin [Gammaproteobacteria bacterium]
MPQIINTNLFSLNAQRNLNTTQGSLQTSLERLSSGLRINSASDDAAGLAIAERFTSQIRGLNQAIRNSNDGISFSQTAEGALSTATDALQRVRELAVQSANDTNSSTDRQALNNEVQQLIAEVNRISNSTQFNGQNILDGTASTLVFQVGANQNQTISVDGVDARGSVLGANVSVSGSIEQGAINTAVTTDTLTVQGVSVDLSGLSATAATTTQVANAINNVTATSGVQAQLNTTVATGPLVNAAGAVTINGVSLTLAGDATDLDTINNFSAQTGVTASGTTGAIVLSNTNGSTIEIDNGVGLGGAAQTVQAGITLSAAVGSTIVVGGAAPAVLNGNAVGAGGADQTANGINVLTQADSNSTLLTVDAALQQINTLRSELGSVQTRFESTISNLQITVENLTAARSRIQDADFAAETANLTRSQILQQAGLAIVAQANSLPQNVLSLLQ